MLAVFFLFKHKIYYAKNNFVAHLAVELLCSARCIKIIWDNFIIVDHYIFLIFEKGDKIMKDTNLARASTL